MIHILIQWYIYDVYLKYLNYNGKEELIMDRATFGKIFSKRYLKYSYHSDDVSYYVELIPQVI